MSNQAGQPSGISVTVAKRTFTFNDVPFFDPGPEFSVEEVKDVATARYPDLATALLETKVTDDGIEYAFIRNVGTKG